MARFISFCRGFGGFSVALFWLACAKPPQPESRGPVDPITGVVPDAGPPKLVGSSTRQLSNVVDTELVGATSGALEVSNAGTRSVSHRGARAAGLELPRDPVCSELTATVPSSSSTAPGPGNSSSSGRSRSSSVRRGSRRVATAGPVDECGFDSI
jgi:hypothetical protein